VIVRLSPLSNCQTQPMALWRWWAGWLMSSRKGRRVEEDEGGGCCRYPRSMAGFFGGGVILMGALGSHVISM
jgi:hypothetical protein